MIRKPIRVGGAVMAVSFAAVVGTIVILVQALVRLLARRHGERH